MSCLMPKQGIRVSSSLMKESMSGVVLLSLILAVLAFWEIQVTA